MTSLKPLVQDSCAVTAAVLKTLIQRSSISGTRRRDMISALSRLCRLAGVTDHNLALSAPRVRKILNENEPAAAGISRKTLANLRSNLQAALALCGVTDPAPTGAAAEHLAWAELVKAVQHDLRLKNGLATFMNYCAAHSIDPKAVSDATVEAFGVWLETRTIRSTPEAIVAAVPRRWNEARTRISGWPEIRLALPPKRTHPSGMSWQDLPPVLRAEIDAYLAARAKPDPFDERPDAPVRPLKEGTIRQQRAHLKLAATVLKNHGQPAQHLSDLVEPDAVKLILTHYLKEAEASPAFIRGLSVTFSQVASMHLRVPEEQRSRLKRMLRRLPAEPAGLTDKNMALIRKFEDERLVLRLASLPQRQMQAGLQKKKRGERNWFVNVQAALAIRLLLVAPMRSQNLITLNVGRHIQQTGRDMRLVIPAGETKTGRQDFVFLLDPDTAALVRRYCREVLPALGEDPKGHLFVLPGGRRRGQGGLSGLITRTIKQELGIHMTPHQFRHLAADLYLKEHPEDFETVRLLLGHAYAKTTRRYGCLREDQASRSYNKTVLTRMARIKRQASPKRCRG